MHRSSGLQVSGEKTCSVRWDGVRSLADWYKTQPVDTWKTFFEENGYLKVDSLVNGDELQQYRDIYQRMQNGEIDTSSYRHDLGNHVSRKTNSENVMQIMWPSEFVDGLVDGPIHQRALAVARAILGQDIAHDFDMLIAKAPHTDTETPWHQDEGYWPDMPDKRAVSCWTAVDEATVDNGCMWFISQSHKGPVRPHRPVTPEVHVLTCCDAVKETEGKPVPLKPGGATFHHGKTCHFTRGNTTDTNRRAFIVNYRPEDMVRFEREAGFDHGKKNGVRGIEKTGQTHIK